MLLPRIIQRDMGLALEGLATVGIPEELPLPSVGKGDGDGHPADQGDPSPEVY